MIWQCSPELWQGGSCIAINVLRDCAFCRKWNFGPQLQCVPARVEGPARVQSGQYSALPGFSGGALVGKMRKAARGVKLPDVVPGEGRIEADAGRPRLDRVWSRYGVGAITWITA